MSDELAGAATGFPELSPEASRALAALLAIDADDAARVREHTPSRRRPARQYGPHLDLGGPDR